jgi:FlaA1/EpsC-like NDP-sugar epimerase
MTIPDAIQLVL